MLRELTAPSGLAAEVEEGLIKLPRSLPCKLFYDGAGSALFERITTLPEYYLTRLEHQILRERSAEIAATVDENVTLVELGAGSAAKTCTLLSALAARQNNVRYVPVDISKASLDEARARVSRQCPTVCVQPAAIDFMDGLDFLQEIPGRKLIAYLGSSIGNFDPEARVGFLREIRDEAAPGDCLLLGTDLAKDPDVLFPAYNDSRGVTAEFNKNILSHVNREFSADFNLAQFRHIAIWNAEELRIEMYLESTCAQTVNVRALHLVLPLAQGERIHTENSFKFTQPVLSAMFIAAGFVLDRTWRDQKRWYAVHLARV